MVPRNGGFEAFVDTRVGEGPQRKGRDGRAKCSLMTHDPPLLGGPLCYSIVLYSIISKV